MPALCTRQDVYRLGLGPDALASSRLRPIESVNAEAGVLILDGAGLFEGEPFALLVQGSPIPGEPAPQLPLGLSDAVAYEAVPVGGSSSLFRARPVGGSTIASFGDRGVGVFSLRQDQGPTIDAIAADESAQMEDALTAHAIPLKVDPQTGLYPQTIVGVVARRTAIRAALRLGLSNPNYQASLDRLLAGEALDNRRIDDWIKGRPINGAVTDQTTTLENAARGGRDAAPVGWRTGTL